MDLYVCVVPTFSSANCILGVDPVASLYTSNITVDFPIYNARMRSLRNRLLYAGTGGRIGHYSDRTRPCVRALENVTLHFQHGDRVGLVGHNGAGKTTLLRVLSGAYEPTHGHVSRNGRTSALLNISRGIDAESTGYDNILIRGLLLGLRAVQVRERMDEIAEFTELGDYLSMPVYTYSTGMRLRLAFAICTSFETEILLMDEWLSVGDKTFLAKAQRRLDRLVEGAGILVLASHNTALIKRICNKGVMLESGRVKAIGNIESLL